MKYTNKISGISLVELIVVLTIMILLAVIGFPSYQTYLMESRRSEAINTLRENQALIENYVQQNNVLPNEFEFAFKNTSPNGFYTIVYEIISSDRYRLTASADPTKSQINDTDCTTLILGSDMDGVFPVNCY